MNRIKLLMLCLALMSGTVVCGNARVADSLERLPDGVYAPEEEEGSKRSETEEAADFDAAAVKELYEYAGSGEGIELYIRPENYRELIWASHGGEPKKGEKLTPEREIKKEKAEAEISAAQKIGEAAAIYSESGKPAASLKKLCTNGEIVRYRSLGERYIADVGKNDGSLKNIYSLVSSLDSDIAYLTDGGRVLTLMSSEGKSAEDTLSYSTSRDGMRIYENKKTGDEAWLTEDMTHYYGTFRCCAENEKFRLLADMRTSLMGIESRETGYIWWSSPLEANRDPKANEMFAAELRSSSVLGYGIPEKRNDGYTLRSGYNDDCTVSAEQIPGGIRVRYNYKKDGFRYPVDYTLGSDCLTASLRVSEIEETAQGKLALRVKLLGSFGAATDSEQGYFVIPDGSGALVRFGSTHSEGKGAYMQRIYGDDVTAVPTTKGAVSEQIYLPVYGIVKGDNALLAVADKGDANAMLSVKTSSQSNTSYNLCSFIFNLRSTDSYYMTGSSNTSFTVFEKGGIKSGDIEVRYYPIKCSSSGDSSGYMDIAARYRQYLMEEKGVTKRACDDSAPLYAGIYGGVQKKQSVLGIPVTMKTSVTDYSQASDILEKLSGSGVDEMVISYDNWTNSGIKNQVDVKAKPSGTLGGKKAFRELMSSAEKCSAELYPVSDSMTFRSGSGYYTFTDAAVRVSGAYSRIVSYDRAFGIPDGFAKNKSLLSPEKFSEVFSKTAKNYKKNDIGGIAIASFTTALYGDYGKRTISRNDAMNKLQDSLAMLDDELGGILADGANAYALPYVSHIMNVPTSSSRYDMFDEDIPFYQLVIHGIIPYSAAAVNASANPADAILRAAASGSCLNYDFIYEDASLLKDTQYDIYYYANYKKSVQRAAAAYDLVKPILSKISGSEMTGFTADGSVYTASYANGVTVTVDIEKRLIVSGSEVCDISALEREGNL